MKRNVRRSNTCMVCPSISGVAVKGGALRFERLFDEPVARIKYGEESFYKNYPEVEPRQHCQGCGCLEHEYHIIGCSIEECPVCHGSILACKCEHTED